MTAAINFSQMSPVDLARLIERAQQAQEKQTSDGYGRSFCEQIGGGDCDLGLKILSGIPTVDPKEINLTWNSKYLQGQVTPASMGNLSVAKGILEGRHFVAIKVQVRYPENIKLTDEALRVTTVVEIVFQRYSASDRKGNYVTTLDCMTNDREKVYTTLYSTGGMRSQQLQAVGQLLQGKEIEAINSRSDKRLVKMV